MATFKVGEIVKKGKSSTKFMVVGRHGDYYKIKSGREKAKTKLARPKDLRKVRGWN